MTLVVIKRTFLPPAVKPKPKGWDSPKNFPYRPKTENPYAKRQRGTKLEHLAFLAAGFPVSNIAAAMGHTLEVHLESYARFIPDATADLYAKRNAAPKAA